MCAIIVDVALCDSSRTYAVSDLPCGCLTVYPYTHSETICEAAGEVLGSCRNVEMQKREDNEGGRIEKRICDTCTAYSALMRGKDGRKARCSFREGESPLLHSEDSHVEAMTPQESEVSSEFEADVEDNDTDGDGL